MQVKKDKTTAESQTSQTINSVKPGKEFLKEVLKMQGGEKILDCIQCGTCAGGCSSRFAMDYSPMQIIKMINLGMKEEVLSSSTIWVCSTCYTCATRCPRDISFATLTMSLKNKAIKENFGNSINRKFHRCYFEIVNKNGRMHETELMLKLIPKTDLGKVRRNAGLGLRMMRKKKVKFRAEKIKHTSSLSKMLEKTNEERSQ